MLKKESLQLGELDIRVLLKTLLLNLRVVIGLPLVVALVSVLVSFLFPPVWGGGIMVEVGQFGRLGTNAVLVEAPELVVSRIMNPNFVDDILRDRDGIRGHFSPNDAALFHKSIRAKAIKKTNLVQIDVRGYSPQLAKDFVTLAAERLVTVHTSLSAPRFKSMKEELDLVNEDFSSHEAMIKIAKKTLRIESGVDLRDTMMAQLLFEHMVSVKKRLVERKLEIEEKLHPDATFLTNVVNEAVVTEKPISPNRALIAMVAFFTTLVVTAFVVIAYGHIKS